MLIEHKSYIQLQRDTSNKHEKPVTAKCVLNCSDGYDKIFHCIVAISYNSVCGDYWLGMIVPIATLLREDAKCASTLSPPLLPPITIIV